MPHVRKSSAADLVCHNLYGTNIAEMTKIIIIKVNLKKSYCNMFNLQDKQVK